MKLIFIGLVVLFSVLLGAQWYGWDDHSQMNGNNMIAPDQGGGEIADALPNAADLLTPPAPKEEYVAITERPLFLPDRRLPEEQPQDTEAIEPEPEPVDDTALKGLDFNAVLISDETSIAWIRLPSEQGLLRVRQGDDIKGWKVADILEDRLLLRYQEAERQFVLRDYANAPRLIPPTRLPPLPAQPQVKVEQRNDGSPASNSAQAPTQPSGTRRNAPPADAGHGPPPPVRKDGPTLGP